MFTVIIFFLVLSVLVIIHEFGHFIVAKKNGVKVEEFGFGLPPRILGIKFGETLYSLNLLPFGGFVKLLGEEEGELRGKKLSKEELSRTFSHKKPWQKALVISAGVICNFMLGWVIISYLFTRGVPVPSGKVKVESVAVKSPAQYKLVKDDIIKRIVSGQDQIIVQNVSDLSVASKKYAGKEISITVLRRGESETVTIVPRKNPPKGQGALGITITDYMIKKYSWIEAPFYGLAEAANMTMIIFRELSKTLVQFVTFQKPQADIAGPVGIARLTSQAARAGIDPLLQLVGILSLNLAVINILPFPALDGGRLVLVLYEWIGRRKVNPTVEQRLNFVGFAVLMSMIILVTIHDIINLFK